MFQTVDRFDAEVTLNHGCSDTFLETTDEDASCELFSFFILFARIGSHCASEGETGSERWHHAGIGRSAHTGWHTHGGRSHGEGLRVQLFHVFLLLKLLLAGINQWRIINYHIQYFHS